MEGKNCEDFSIEVIHPNEFTCDGTDEIHGIMDTQEVELTINVSSSEVGTKKAYYLITCQDGVPMSFAVEASFRGPDINVIEPNVDFGLMKINHQQSFRLNIENITEIPATILLKHKDDSLGFMDVQSEFERPITTKAGNTYSFSPNYTQIPAFSSTEILVTIDCKKEEKISDIIEIKVQNALSHFIYLKANI